MVWCWVFTSPTAINLVSCPNKVLIKFLSCRPGPTQYTVFHSTETLGDTEEDDSPRHPTRVCPYHSKFRVDLHEVCLYRRDSY